ncbi:MAG: EAL domain-containing protein [Actinomycetia bacterium]|nr:EAL domain-containing protein [Actinomycetes bacterium]MCP4959741.1 EAL domain-containing protein [Actinomycetes bacterium]
MTLRRKILLISLAMVVPLALLTIAAYLTAREGMLDQAQIRVESEARLVAAQAERQLEIAQGELAGIAEWHDLAAAVDEGNQTTRVEALLEAVDTWWKPFGGFALVDASGNLVARTAGHNPVLGSANGPDAAIVDERVIIRDEVASTGAFIETSVDVSFVFADGRPAEAPDSGDLIVASAMVDDLATPVFVWQDRSDVLGPLGTLRVAVVVGLLASLFLAVGGALWLGRKAARRLSALTELTEAMGEGDWSRRAGAHGRDELGQLSASIDRMAEQVELDRRRRRQIEDRLAHQALHDPLTGLANRAKFLDRLGDALARSSRSGAPVAVLFCDLDNLKVVNDQMGHNAGDDLLVGIAARMAASVRPSDTVARFGGDEFVVLCAEMAATDDATIVADRLMLALAEPFAVQGELVSSSASVGIAVGSGISDTADALVRDADAAMYAAKRAGKARYVLHDESIDLGAAVRDRNRREAVKAMDENELRLDFQPILELENGRLHAVEALVRWDHPDLGVLAPDQILQRFAAVGLELDLDAWVIDRAAAQVDHWNALLELDGAPVRVSVNVTATSLLGDDLPHRLEKAIGEHSIDPAQLLVEVSERDLGADPLRIVGMLDRLRAIGVGIALDDFGTAHTSLERLHRYGADLMKIDQSLIARLAVDAESDGGAVAAILAVASSLDIDAVAEGVEQLEQVPELLLRGCRYAQGNLFCGPLDDRAVVLWLDRLGI